MKILYGITKGNFGGAQRYVFDLATEAKKLGNDVSVICGEGGTLAEKLRAENIKVYKITKLVRDVTVLDDVRAFLSIYRILREEKPDVFHINSSKMGGVGGLAARLAGIRKIVFTSHGWAFNEKRSWYQRLIIRFVYWVIIVLSHKTICVSDKTREQIALFPFIKNRLVVIHNGVAPFNLSPENPRKMLVVGALSELHHIKGLDVLLNAWSRFVKKHGARLVICGDGEESDKLKGLAEELGIRETVEFRGYVENARKELLNFDILVMPSRSENLPYTILEAGFAGLPVIASRVGGIPEIIESGANGILVPKEDSEAIFSSLVLLADDPELRRRLGNELKKTIEQEFTLSKMVRDTLNAYV